MSCPEGFYYGWWIWDPKFYPLKNDEAEQMNGWSKTILQKHCVNSTYTLYK